MLLSAGANWKIGEKDGYTCMHGAAFQGLPVYTHVHAISNREVRRPTACLHACNVGVGVNEVHDRRQSRHFLSPPPFQAGLTLFPSVQRPFICRATQGGRGGNQGGRNSDRSALDTFQVTGALCANGTIPSPGTAS
jgi:hypothetical protein